VEPLLEPRLSNEVEEWEKMTDCIICGRKSEGRYCQLHKRAHANLVKGFETWSRAMDIEWRDYLKRVAEHQNTGKWVVEVCKDLLDQEGRS